MDSTTTYRKNGYTERITSNTTITAEDMELWYLIETLAGHKVDYRICGKVAYGTVTYKA